MVFIGLSDDFMILYYNNDGIKKNKPLDIEIGYDTEEEDHKQEDYDQGTKDDQGTKETDQILQIMSDTLDKLNDHMEDRDKDRDKKDVEIPETPRSTTSSAPTHDLFNESKHRKFDVLVYDEDMEIDLCPNCSEPMIDSCDEDADHCWSKHKKHRLHRCLWKLKYNRIVSSFYLDNLRSRKNIGHG